MEHSISQVARMAGVSSRTLRHYDDIGLLPPSRVSASGYRWYGRRQLLRLQRILLLRELRVPLSRVADIVDGASDELAALRSHREQLVDERDRLQQIIDTVDRTIADLSGRGAVDDEDFFVGLARGRDRLREDLSRRFGDGVEQQFTAAEAATSGWSREDYERAAADGRRLFTEMSEARDRGVAPDDDEALDLVARHHAGVTALWPADATAYHALGDLLLEDPQQRAVLERVDPLLPPWLSTAVKAYALHRLGHDPARPDRPGQAPGVSPRRCP